MYDTPKVVVVLDRFDVLIKFRVKFLQGKEGIANRLTVTTENYFYLQNHWR